MGAFLNNSADLLGTVLHLYFYAVIIAVALNLVGADPFNPVVRFFRQITEPLFRRLRAKFPFLVIGGRLDLSPLVVLVALSLVNQLLVAGLRRLAAF